MINFAYMNMKTTLCKIISDNMEIMTFILNTKNKFDYKNDEWVVPWLLTRSMEKLVQNEDLANEIKTEMAENGYFDNEDKIVEEALKTVVTDILNGEKDYGF